MSSSCSFRSTSSLSSKFLMFAAEVRMRSSAAAESTARIFLQNKLRVLRRFWIACCIWRISASIAESLLEVATSIAMLLRNFFDFDEEDTYWASIYRVVEESRHASPNLMAGTILASSPHYFSAVEDYHACLMKNWLALATLRSKQNLPQSHCLYEQTNFVQPAYVEKKRFDILCQ